MTFDDWMITKVAKYKPSDDSERVRILRECWKQSAIEDRGRCAKWFEEHEQNRWLTPDECADAIRALGDYE